jgi:hypothetical protein
MNMISTFLIPVDDGKPNRLVYRCHSSLVFGTFSVRISAGIPDIMTEVYLGIPQSVQANTGTVPRFGHDRFLRNPFHFIFLLFYHPALYTLSP